MPPLQKNIPGVTALEEKKVDRRVRRTKRQLRMALTSLMLKKDIGTITVHEITELADVNRGTFYSHYKDVNDLLSQLEENIFVTLEAVATKYDPADSGSDTYQFIFELLTLIGENADVCKALLCNNGDVNFQRRLFNALKDQYFRKYLTHSLSGDTQRLEYYCTFIVAGILYITTDWLNGDMQDSPQDLAEICVDFISRGNGKAK